MPHECKSTYNRYTKKYQPYCSECGRFFSDQASCEAHLLAVPIEPIEPEITLPAVEFGEYVTHKAPTPRSGDTLLGKVMGYLSEMLFWADNEGKCSFVDVVVPDWFPINAVQGILWALFKKHYNANYQKQYNRGADQGNKIHNAVFGWIDDATKDVRDRLEAMLNDAKSKLQSQISELQRLADRYSSQLGELDSAKNKLLADVEDLDERLRALEAQKLPFVKVPTVKEFIYHE